MMSNSIIKCSDTTQNSYSIFQSLGPKIFQKMTDHLSIQDWQAFELAAKVHQTLTNLIWEKLRQRDYFTFDWADCENETYKDKWNYYLSASLIRYLDLRKECTTFNQLMQCYSVSPDFRTSQPLYKFIKKLEGLRNRFFNFAAYINQDVSYLKITSSYLEASVKCLKISEKKLGGEHLLDALLQVNCSYSDKKAINDKLVTAMKSHATYASLFALKYCDIMSSYSQSLALEAASQNDMRALEVVSSFMTLQELENLYNSNYSYPPVLINYAIKLFESNPEEPKNLITVENLLDQGIYDNMPAWSLNQAAKIKFKLVKYQEADKFYRRAIQAFGDNVFNSIFAEAAATKLKLGKLQEAEEFYSKSLQLKIDSAISIQAAHVKLMLEKPEEAEDIYAKAIESKGKYVPVDLMIKAADTKFELKKWQEAYNLYSKAIADYYGGYLHLPAEVFVKAADAKLKQNNLEEARTFLAEAAHKKLELQKWQDAEKLFTKLITTFSGSNIPPEILVNAAIPKLNLEKWQEAYDLYDKVIVTYGAVAQILANAAYAKLRSGDLKKSEEYYKKALDAFSDKVPPNVLADAALTKFALDKLNEAEDLFTKSIEAFKVDKYNVPANVLIYAAITKQKLSKWQEADEFYRKGIYGYQGNVPPDLLAQAAAVKLQLDE